VFRVLDGLANMGCDLRVRSSSQQFHGERLKKGNGPAGRRAVECNARAWRNGETGDDLSLIATPTQRACQAYQTGPKQEQRCRFRGNCLTIAVVIVS
jgi:hypothetical protein